MYHIKKKETKVKTKKKAEDCYLSCLYYFNFCQKMIQLFQGPDFS